MPVGKSLEKSALIVAILTSFMGPFTISSINVALPSIQAEFSADAVLLSWVATSYLLAMAVFIGREQIYPSNYDQFLKSVKVAFLIFSS